ncbi:NAD(P)-dependent dehydrogenase (short-subunit alcohol dehydrogenase family) [Amycolatopsis bartoniae]|uniref:Short-chain dehydrogenase n=1 Tax=Amycolatopsis bartoniae TaxID=941986 RepID=A0A8H9M387_9PSEU|nr:SDR family oxidoreductase [Amycolatopsis bartoniae]MBB2939662.1 NAD(P)-dependent dehydrogenase (short-subunit alcohol dehydrogenase family) [Amycolatopsis bartoniae]TVT06232.1 SDR family oxidoreductase [Amycolatopsis bartoniae]GHF36689.1 short-chain dehydrogenase [Amycolatopsis bartoniae]
MDARPCVVITGAGGLMGSAVAATLAAEGYDLVLNDRREGSLLPVAKDAREAGARVATVTADISTVEGAQALTAAAHEQWAAVAGLVHVAGGIKGPVKNPVWSITPAEWARTMAVNADSIFHCVQAVLPDMMARRRGRIVAIGSTSWAGSPDHAHYAAAKAALVSFIRSVATQVGPYDVTANVIAPGGTVTFAADLPGFPTAAEWATRNPLGRPNSPEDIAGAVRFLLGPDARNISGQVLTVAGGLNPCL